MYETYLTKSLAGLVNATQALEAYHKTKIKDIKNTAAYHVQQSLEYIIKYLIYNCGSYNNGRSEENISQIYSHNLDLLIVQYCDIYQIAVPQKIRDKAILYTSWEAESRYSLGFSVRANVIQTAIKNISAWLVEIAPRYKKKIDETSLFFQHLYNGNCLNKWNAFIPDNPLANFCKKIYNNFNRTCSKNIHFVTV